MDTLPPSHGQTRDIAAAVKRIVVITVLALLLGLLVLGVWPNREPDQRKQIGYLLMKIMDPLADDAARGVAPSRESIAAAIIGVKQHASTSSLASRYLPAVMQVNTSLAIWTGDDPDSTDICVGAWIGDDPPEFLGITLSGWGQLLDHEPAGDFITVRIDELDEAAGAAGATQ